MTVYLVTFLQKIPYIHRICVYIYGSGQPYIFLHLLAVVSGVVTLCYHISAASRSWSVIGIAVCSVQ